MSSSSDARLRSELEAAINNVRRQIAVQSTADHYIGSEAITEEALRELHAELHQLQDALSGLP